MNVLLVTFSFPPAGGVGVLRALSLAKYLPEFGVRLDVLTAKNAPAVGTDTSLLRQVPAEVTVHQTWTPDLPFGVRKAIKRVVSGGRVGKKGSSAAGSVAAERGSNPLKALVGNLLLPDPQVGWLPFAFRAARRIVRERAIDVVLITVPPFSTVRLVTMLRRQFPRLPIVLDFRDEWLTTTMPLVSFNNNERARRVAEKAEAEAVRDATAVVAVTEAARGEIAGRYPEQPEAKFVYLPNGFDGVLPRETPARAGSGETVVLTYLGTVYGSTDPGTFVEAVLGLPGELRARLRVRYIGHVETPALRASLLRLGETLELRGFVPQAEALRAIDDTTYLLLITHDRINVAAKFYDYLGSGKRMVAAVHPEGDVRRLLERTRAGWWSDAGDVGAIGRMLVEVLSGAASEEGLPGPDFEEIARFHRRAVAERYGELLTRVAAGAGAGRETQE